MGTRREPKRGQGAPRNSSSFRAHAAAGRRTISAAQARAVGAMRPTEPPLAPGRVPDYRPRMGNNRRRARALFIATLFVFSIFAVQLLRLQWFEAGSIAKGGRDQRQGTTKLPAVRGQVTDAHGVVLAQSIERYTVASCPRDVRFYGQSKDPKKRQMTGPEGAAQELSPLLGMSAEQLLPLLSGTENECYKIVKKGVEPLQWRKIAERAIPGISAQMTQERLYPGGSAAAPLIGWVGNEGEARKGHGGGLELLMNEKLTGKPGQMTAEYSVNGRVIPMGERELRPAIRGRDVRLTIDNDLQWYAYNAIAAQVQASKGDSGYAVVMDKKGRIRAAAQYPAFDPVTRAKGSRFDALPFTDVFEPGSTAKVMSIGAALNEGLIDPTSQFVVENRLPRADQQFRDAHDHATLNLTSTGILAVSSNIGTIQIAEKMPAEKLESYYRSFGMGKTSAVGFPGESDGLMPRTDKLSASQRYTMMFGQGFSLTAMQDIGVFQTVANGGVRIPATLVEGSADAEGRYVPSVEPEGERVLSEDASKTLLKMMENVTNVGGTAVTAELPGYRVAGKTGTSDRYDDAKKGYSGTTASFIGIAPADDPELITAVIVQNPKNEGLGSDHTAPVFKSVMTYALQKLKIPPTGSSLDPFPNYWGEQASRNKTR